jgi:hypothetical protein
VRHSDQKSARVVPQNPGWLNSKIRAGLTSKPLRFETQKSQLFIPPNRGAKKQRGAFLFNGPCKTTVSKNQAENFIHQNPPDIVIEIRPGLNLEIRPGLTSKSGRCYTPKSVRAYTQISHPAAPQNPAGQADGSVARSCHRGLLGLAVHFFSKIVCNNSATTVAPLRGAFGFARCFCTRAPGAAAGGSHACCFLILWVCRFVQKTKFTFFQFFRFLSF